MRFAICTDCESAIMRMMCNTHNGTDANNQNSHCVETLIIHTSEYISTCIQSVSYYRQRQRKLLLFVEIDTVRPAIAWSCCACLKASRPVR